MWSMLYQCGDHICVWQVCLLGGADESGAQLEDAWVLDLSANGWTKLPDAALPSVRAWHSAQMVQTDKVCILKPCPSALSRMLG